MSPSKSQISNLATALDITQPTDIDRAILSAMILIQDMFSPTSTPTSTGSSSSAEQMIRLLTLHETLSKKARHVLALKTEFQSLRELSKTWFKTIYRLRTRRMDGKNPWREEARQLLIIHRQKTGTSTVDRRQIAKEQLLTTNYLIRLKYTWKATYKEMARLEKSLSRRTNPARKEFVRLLADSDAVDLRRFEADLRMYRDLAFYLSVEYTKIDPAYL